MKCKDVQEQLLFYMENELSHKESEKIKAHLNECKECDEKYRLYQKTDKALQEFGEAVREGLLSIPAPPLSLPERPLWTKFWNGFQIPVPLWRTAVVNVIVALAISTFFLGWMHIREPRIEPGSEKGVTANAAPKPLSSEEILNFLLHPDPTDPVNITSVIELIENNLKDYPDDLALHVKLVELYQAKLKLQSLSQTERTELEEKLAVERRRTFELLSQGGYIGGDENAEK